MVKIALIGTHGTGKTTMAHQIVYDLKKYGIDAGFLGEVARSCPFPINEKTTKKSQIWILLTQIIKELESEDKNDILVCDRSALDPYCYYIWKFGASEALEALVKNHMKTYDYIVKVPITEGFLKKDRQRSVEKEFQKEIDIIIDKTLKRLSINYIHYSELNELLKKEIINKQ